ncbi:hypothetical protein CARUB_v10018937mg, partial [Capsella rubella]
VKIESLEGKKIGLYFSVSRCGLSQKFTPQLVEVYNELSPTVGFEIVFVSFDEDEESFKDYFIKMPWLAVPFTSSETCKHLAEMFKVRGSPTLVIVNDRGEVVNEDAFCFTRTYGADAYPFTPERMKEVKDEEGRARIEQSLESVLVTPSRDFVISQDGNKSLSRNLKNGEDFEIVLIAPGDFKQDLTTHPWMSLPLDSKNALKLARHFNVSRVPTLVILGPDGKTRHSNVAEAIDEYGVLVYHFTTEKFEELKEIEKAKAEPQTLESLLVSDDLNYVLGKDGDKVLVYDLVGKDVLLYFSAQWSFRCRAFTQILVEVYKHINKDQAFELIFISSDRDQEAFEEYYSQMPWLALPFGDSKKPSLAKTFKVKGNCIPRLVSAGQTGKTVTKEAIDLVRCLLADAYPVTVERMKEIQVEYEMAKGWPEKLQHPLHEEHELKLSFRMRYICDKCDESGKIWSYYCRDCDFDLHLKCALKKDTKETGDEASKDGGDGWVCN